MIKNAAVVSKPPRLESLANEEYKDQQKSLAETNNKIDGLTTNNQTIVSEMDALKNEQIELTSSLAALVFDLETYRFAGKYFNDAA